MKFVNFLKSRLIFSIFYCFWMFVNKPFTYIMYACIKSKRCFNVKSSTYHFYTKKEILADFQICISVPLKISQYSQEKTCAGISLLIKIWSFRVPALLKRDSNTSVFCELWEIFKNTYFEEHLRTAASESFPTWTDNKEREEDVFSKIKQNKNPLKTQLY